MVAFATAALVLAASAQANPIYERIYRRQDLTSVATDLASSATELVSSALETASALSSSAATALVPAASSSAASASASSSGGLEFPAYPCEQGLLTYVETRQAYPGVSLELAVAYLSNWAQGVLVPLIRRSRALSDDVHGRPFPIVASSGTNETGATRTYTVSGFVIRPTCHLSGLTFVSRSVNISDVLVNQTIDATTGALTSDWNITSPISSQGITVYQAANHLDYYSNSTT
jgi:hypothetical protein